MRPHVRVYHEDLQRDYPEVWTDDRLLSAWLRLLVLSDKAWPSMAEIPRSASPAAIRSLVTIGLVELMPSYCYRIKGYESERTARQDAARIGAGVRWRSGRNATAMPSTETETETEITPPPPSADGGRRKNGRNPRATGTSPRQVEQRIRADAPRRLGEVLEGVREFQAHIDELGAGKPK